MFVVSGRAENEGSVYEYRLESLGLRNGFKFAPGKLTVIVGPNNSGKSRLLHDVKQLCTSQTPDTVVVKEAKYTRPSSPADLRYSYRITPQFDPLTNQVMFRTLDADMGGLIQVPFHYGSPADWESAYEQLVRGMLEQWDLLDHARIYQPITMEIPPWFSAEKVSQEYKRVKERIPTTPQPSERRMALFEFVMKHPEVTVPGEGQVPSVPSWARLLRSWNESLPDGSEWYCDDRRNFRRDFLKAFQQIVNYYR